MNQSTLGVSTSSCTETVAFALAAVQKRYFVDGEKRFALVTAARANATVSVPNLD